MAAIIWTHQRIPNHRINGRTQQRSLQEGEENQKILGAYFSIRQCEFSLRFVTRVLISFGTVQHNTTQHSISFHSSARSVPWLSLLHLLVVLTLFMAPHTTTFAAAEATLPHDAKAQHRHEPKHSSEAESSSSSSS